VVFRALGTVEWHGEHSALGFDALNGWLMGAMPRSRRWPGGWSSLYQIRQTLLYQIRQTLTDRSLLPETSNRPPGEKATDSTASVCPLRVQRRVPVGTSQSRTVLSELPLASVRPSGEKATEFTYPVWPGSVRRRRPVWAS